MTASARPESAEDRIRTDLHMRPAPLATVSGKGDGVDHVIDGGVDSQQGPVAEDPDAARTHLDFGGRHAESDRAHDVQGSRIDPQQGVVVAIADPDRAFADGGPCRSPADGNLADDRVRFGIDDRDGVAHKLKGRGCAARRVASGRNQSGRDREDERGGERESPARRESPLLPDHLGRFLCSGPQRPPGEASRATNRGEGSLPPAPADGGQARSRAPR